MNKHFLAILEMLPAYDVVSNEITLTQRRNIFIMSSVPFPDICYSKINDYCKNHELSQERYSVAFKEVLIIKNQSA